MITIYVIAVIFMATVFVMFGRYTIGRIRCYRRSRHLANQRMRSIFVFSAFVGACGAGVVVADTSFDHSAGR
ncbi:hypothetical protein, partial [uncultured Alistipes sp.]|uniref:hypothetical protein n=1 Tax=uncultured Alistipes sp. TaxID=538949 RepID=UPI0025D3242F